MDNTSMTLGLTCVIAALVLAFCAGWGFGRAAPSWELDEENEDTASYRRYGPFTGEGWSPYSAGSRDGCAAIGGQLTRGGGLGLLAGVAAYFLGMYGAGRLPGLFHADYTMLYIALSVAALAGYVVSRVTDKGPVGPLE